MKASWLTLLVAAVALAGCADGANPSLSAPKLVLAPRSNGEIAAFVHAAFGERLYENVTLAVDNETLATVEDAFSLERSIAKERFYFEATAETARETYGLRGWARLLPLEEQVEVAFLGDDGQWSDPQEFGLPFERVMTLRETP